MGSDSHVQHYTHWPLDRIHILITQVIVEYGIFHDLISISTIFHCDEYSYTLTKSLVLYTYYL